MTNPTPISANNVKPTRFEAFAARLIDVYEWMKPRKWRSDLYRALQIPADWHFAQAAYIGVKGEPFPEEYPTEEEETERVLAALFQKNLEPLEGSLVITGMQMHLSRLDRALSVGYAGKNRLKRAATRAYLLEIAIGMGMRARELIASKLVSEPRRYPTSLG